jgi:hypothetical protein
VTVVVAVVVVVIVAVVVTVVVVGLVLGLVLALVAGVAAVAGRDPLPQPASPRAAIPHATADDTESVRLAPLLITSGSHTPAARRASA